MDDYGGIETLAGTAGAPPNWPPEISTL